MRTWLLPIGLALMIDGAGLWVIARYHRMQAEVNRQIALDNLKVASENSRDAETIAALAESNADASRQLALLAQARGASQDEVPRCRCGLLLRKTRPDEAGYPDGRVCPVRSKHPGHDFWLPV